MKKNDIKVKIMAGIMAAFMVFSVVAGFLIYFFSTK